VDAGGGGGATRFFSEPWMLIEMSGAMGVGTVWEKVNCN
jgi:hypothetical protein